MNDSNINTIISNLTIWSLFLVFLVLKLTGVINWSWWWITAPLWGSILLGITVFFVVLTILFLKK